MVVWGVSEVCVEGFLGECQDSVWRDVCGGEVSEGCLEVFWGVSGGVRWSGMGLGVVWGFWKGSWGCQVGLWRVLSWVWRVLGCLGGL